jgi:hypothetical protein
MPYRAGDNQNIRVCGIQNWLWIETKFCILEKKTHF